MKSKDTLKLVGLMLLALTAAFAGPFSVSGQRGKYSFAKSDDANLRIYSSDELTYDILSSRNGALIWERIEGMCLDTEGNGKVITHKGSDYDYISYRKAKHVKPGDQVVTYCLYNPENNYEDDIILRYDYVVGHENLSEKEKDAL